MDLTNGFTPYGYAIIPNLWIRKKDRKFSCPFGLYAVTLPKQIRRKSRLRAS